MGSLLMMALTAAIFSTGIYVFRQQRNRDPLGFVEEFAQRHAGELMAGNGPPLAEFTADSHQVRMGPALGKDGLKLTFSGRDRTLCWRAQIHRIRHEEGLQITVLTRLRAGYVGLTDERGEVLRLELPELERQLVFVAEGADKARGVLSDSRVKSALYGLMEMSHLLLDCRLSEGTLEIWTLRRSLRLGEAEAILARSLTFARALDAARGAEPIRLQSPLDLEEGLGGFSGSPVGVPALREGE